VSLHALQSALAELFVDPDARTRFERDARRFASERGLDAIEASQLTALSSATIAGYAAALVRKRCAEAARLLPRTWASLGNAFAPAFTAWAPRAMLREGSSRYAWDALAFCRHLLAQPNLDPRVRAAVRGDRAGLRSAVDPVAGLVPRLMRLLAARER
jgi:hypothetical protein